MMSAVDGIWSGPVVHLGLRVERACSHKSGVAIRRERRLGRRFGRWNRNRDGNSSMSGRRRRSGNVGAHRSEVSVQLVGKGWKIWLNASNLSSGSSKMSVTCHRAVDKSSSKLACQKCLKEQRVTVVGCC